MVSISAPHFFNWAEQLRDSGHDVYWLDVFDSNSRVDQLKFVEQIIGWRYKWRYPGRYLVKSKFPALNNFINVFNERDLVEVFKTKLQEIKPDVVHSFVMSHAVVPLYKIMKANPEIKWVYSSWGSDLYFYENKGLAGRNIKKVLPRLDFMFSDCKRDYEIARQNGLIGKFLGVFPGGGGYDFSKSIGFKKPFLERNIILIKGYQGKHGRCIEVLKAIQRLEVSLYDKKIVVFGANKEVFDFAFQNDLWFKDRLKIFSKISHFKVLELMGKAFVYIGNSISDGMPNTMLEAIIMEAFPIQSNPGGATEELIEDGKNGFIIQNPENSEEITALIKRAFSNQDLIIEGIHFNNTYIKPNLERERVKKQVLKKYEIIETSL